MRSNLFCEAKKLNHHESLTAREDRFKTKNML